MWWRSKFSPRTTKKSIKKGEFAVVSEKIIGFVELLRFLVLKLASYLDFKEMAKNSTWEIIGYLSQVIWWHAMAKKDSSRLQSKKSKTRTLTSCLKNWKKIGPKLRRRLRFFTSDPRLMMGNTVWKKKDLTSYTNNFFVVLKHFCEYSKENFVVLHYVFTIWGPLET